MADALSGVFRQPFAEQVAAFRLRLGDLVPTATWDALTGAQHDRAFMVAGATKADLLADLAKAVDKAISEGTGFDAFQKDFRALVEKNGWHGWTGEGTAKGEAWRMRTIYRTNMATTYAAGRLAQLIDGNFKFWVYKHGGSLEPRLQHLAWNGVALPPDHPFWREHYPPNDWGCSCRVFGADSAAQIKDQGGDPAKALPDGWAVINPRTGTPVGVGKGWDHAPGATVAELLPIVAAKLESLPPQPAVDMIQHWLKSDVFAAWFKKPQGDWPLLRIPRSDADKIGAQGVVVHLSPGTLQKQLAEHPEIGIDEYRLAQTIAKDASHVASDGPLSLIYVLDLGGSRPSGGYVLVIKATRSGATLFVTSLRRLSRKDALRESEIARLLGKGGN